MNYIDGHAEAGDLGSWICTDVRMDKTYGTYQIRSYSGLSTDVSKLPKYDDLATGSSAYCVDSGAIYMYDATAKTWRLQ